MPPRRRDLFRRQPRYSRAFSALTSRHTRCQTRRTECPAGGWPFAPTMPSRAILAATVSHDGKRFARHSRTKSSFFRNQRYTFPVPAYGVSSPSSAIFFAHTLPIFWLRRLHRTTAHTWLLTLGLSSRFTRTTNALGAPNDDFSPSAKIVCFNTGGDPLGRDPKAFRRAAPPKSCCEHTTNVSRPWYDHPRPDHHAPTARLQRDHKNHPKNHS